MQKIKIMLLSLALFAVVGGALAFKAKFTNTWCTTNAYSQDLGSGVITYFCSSTFGVANETTTTTCDASPVQNIQVDNQGTVLKVCTTLPDAGLTPCAKVCDIKTTTKGDGGQ